MTRGSRDQVQWGEKKAKLQKGVVRTFQEKSLGEQTANEATKGQNKALKKERNVTKRKKTIVSTTRQSGRWRRPPSPGPKRALDIGRE